MKIAVITPVGPNANYEHLQKCRASVNAQAHPVDHVMVYDGEYEYATNDDGDVHLPYPSGDFGDTPRAIGSMYAFGQGYDAVCWLDADNWFLPDHVTKLVRAHHNTGFPVITSGRLVADELERYDPQPCVEQNNTLKWDTSTFMVCREARSLCGAWTAMEPNQHIIGDRIVGATAEARGLAHCHGEPTIVYRSNIKFHYDTYGWDTDGVEVVTKEFKG